MDTERKQTVYLDQNILDVLTKHQLGEFRQTLTEDYQVVYSDETLKEIRRSKGFEDNFLNTLKTLNAKHLQIILEQDFTITDRVSVTECCPFDAYRDYCERFDKSISTRMENALHQLLFKLNGGKVEDSMNTAIKDVYIIISESIDMMMEHSSEFPEPNQELLEKITNSLKQLFQAELETFERSILENGQDGRHFNGIKNFRDKVGIGPKQLNNIEPPHVLTQIWGKLRSQEPFSQLNIDIDDFFNLKQNPASPDKPYHNHQKVTAVYNLLNSIGYYPDSKMHKERRFIAALSDNTHASMASFCDFLLSNDESFIKKTKAAFEYLGIQTIVKHVTFSQK